LSNYASLTFDLCLEAGANCTIAHRGDRQRLTDFHLFNRRMLSVTTVKRFSVTALWQRRCSNSKEAPTKYHRAFRILQCSLGSRGPLQATMHLLAEQYQVPITFPADRRAIQTIRMPVDRRSQSLPMRCSGPAWSPWESPFRHPST
jgi:hypothetical protein